MDLTPFFHNVERIATALETIARNTQKPLVTNVSNVTQFDVEELMSSLRPQPLPPFDQAVLDRAMDLDVDVLWPGHEKISTPEPKATPVEHPTKNETVTFTPLDEVIKGIYEGGTISANGIAIKLNSMGHRNDKGRPFNNVTVKPLMTRIGLSSPYDTKPKVEVKPEAPAEAAPEPAPPVFAKKPVLPGSNHFKERDQKREADHMDMTRQLSPNTKARLGAFVKARDDGKSISDATLIADAIAAGKVTHCPAFTDSEGVNHLAAQHSSATSSIQRSGSAFGNDSGGRAAVRGGSR